MYMCVYICVCVYIYIYIHIHNLTQDNGRVSMPSARRDLVRARFSRRGLNNNTSHTTNNNISLTLLYIHIYIHTYINIYIYIYRERERDRTNIYIYIYICTHVVYCFVEFARSGRSSRGFGGPRPREDHEEKPRTHPCKLHIISSNCQVGSTVLPYLAIMPSLLPTLSPELEISGQSENPAN